MPFLNLVHEVLIDLLEEIEMQINYLTLPKLENVNWIYSTNWYDGELEGVVEYQNKRYYVWMVDQNYKSTTWYRRYVIFELSPAEWSIEDERHKDFLDWIGPSGCHYLERIVGKELWSHGHQSDRYYKKWQNNPLLEYQQGNLSYQPKLIGWFQW